MPAKKPKASKPKNYGKLSQKQKFIAAAKAVEVDESGNTFTIQLRRIVPSRTGSKQL